ncbi:hypothetical protein ACX6XY_21735 [Streptomyces sp. O3]
MKTRRRSPSDLGVELWDLVKETGDEGMPREAALEHMTASHFEIAKVWDRDTMCERERECFLYMLGEGAELSPQLRVTHTVLVGMIEAAAPLKHAGFSAEVAVRGGMST